MHPAPSIIFFTTASGAGYGLLMLLGYGAVFDLLPSNRWFGLIAMGLSLGLITAGLVSSTFHLGHPERAWRALSQWRSSWLSREGVMALVTYVPAGLFAIGWVAFETTGGWWTLCAVLAAILALGTVYCTSMIYASLKPIRHWHNRWVPPVFLVFALATGAVWLNVLAVAFGTTETWTAICAAGLTGLAWALKGLYWSGMRHAESGSTIEQATGLGHIGSVRLLDPPHSQDNYLLTEMGFRVARKHADSLRVIAMILGFLTPLAMLVIATAGSGAFAAVMALTAAASSSAGVVVERWLFFAEAQHTVTLYYGVKAA